MKIALAIPGLETGGAEKQLVRLAIELKNRGIQVTVFLIRGSGSALTKQLIDNDIPIHIFYKYPKGSNLIQILLFPYYIYVSLKEMKRERPTIFLSWLSQAIYFYSPLALLTGIKVRGAARRNLRNSLSRPRVAGLLDPIMRKVITFYTSNSEEITDELISIEGIQKKKVFQIHNGVDLNVVQAQPELEPPVGVVVANFHHYKGHKDLIYAVSQCKTNVFIKLVGSGPDYKALVDLIQLLNLETNFEFCGPVTNVSQIYGQCQYALLPSHTEGLPNALIEAMAAGLPLIGTSIGGITELIQDGVNGILVPRSNPARLSEAIDELNLDVQFRIMAGRKSTEFAQKYSWEFVTNMYLDLFKRLNAAKVLNSR